MARRLRIAAAVFFALLALAIVALWVRSFFTKEVVYGWFSSPGYLQIDSNSGCLKLIVNFEHQKSQWKYSSDAPQDNRQSWYYGLKRTRFGWWLDITIPHWFLAALSLSLAALFAFNRHWRFTTRSLLIATTIVAAILGLAVYAL